MKRENEKAETTTEAAGDATQSEPEAKRARTVDPHAAAPAEAEDDFYPEFSEEEDGAGHSESDTAFKVRPRKFPPLPQTVLEEGRITFLYKPKVQKQQAESIDDVQRFHILLEPFVTNVAEVSKASGVPKQQLTEEQQPQEQTGSKGGQQQEGGKSEKPGDDAKEQQQQQQQQQQQEAVAGGAVIPRVARLINVGKKRLPDVNRHDRFFAFVAAVGSSAEELTQGLGEGHYTTKTRGERLQAAARVAGSGVYCICTHKSQKTLLAYELELPTQPGEVQQELNIDSQGALIISVKNPDIKGEAGAPSAGPAPQYSEAEAKVFSGRRWAGVVDPQMLDKQGTELLLIGARKDLKQAGLTEEAAAALGQLQEAHTAAAAAAGGSSTTQEQGAKDGAAKGGETGALVKELAGNVGPAPHVGPAVTSGEWE